MAIFEDEVKQTARSLSKTSQADVETAFKIVLAWAKNFIPNALSESVLTFNLKLYQVVNFVSKTYTPLKEVKADGVPFDVIDPGGVFIAKPEFLKKEVSLFVRYGEAGRVAIVEAVLAELTAELALKISKNLIGVDSISSSFDISSLNTRFTWYDTQQMLLKLKPWYIEEKKREIGCII